MDGRAGQAVLRTAAVVHVLAGVLLVLSTWDGLYDALELPKPVPALLAQLGGLALLPVAYLLWLAAADRALTRPVAVATGMANGAGAVVITLWLAFRGQEDLEVGSSGIAILAVVAAALAALAIAELAVARHAEQ